MKCPRCGNEMRQPANMRPLWQCSKCGYYKL